MQIASFGNPSSTLSQMPSHKGMPTPASAIPCLQRAHRSPDKKWRKKNGGSHVSMGTPASLAYCSFCIMMMPTTNTKNVNPSINAAAMIMLVPIVPLASG